MWIDSERKRGALLDPRGMHTTLSESGTRMPCRSALSLGGKERRLTEVGGISIEFRFTLYCDLPWRVEFTGQGLGVSVEGRGLQFMHRKTKVTRRLLRHPIITPEARSCHLARSPQQGSCQDAPHFPASYHKSHLPVQQHVLGGGTRG